MVLSVFAIYMCAQDMATIYSRLAKTEKELEGKLLQISLGD